MPAYLSHMVERRLKKSLFSAEYGRFVQLLKQARVNAGLSQTEAATRLGKPQSFISKCESGERRVDLLEFLAFCDLYGADPAAIIRDLWGSHARKKKSQRRR